MSFAANAVRRVATAEAVPVLKRSFNTSVPKMGNNPHEGPFVHAKHMYDLPNMPNRTLKWGLGIFGGVATGFGIPIFACWFQFTKAQG
eukprot:CAMPEP_0114308816 /NCGR_PEP_ID=MMETSP0059-20121206/18288_1 /TAXON_ID=36894 /ORGANISM="Pyramimonas parkeae, Strain CCMP726" /LENGTH=87 /DNA_ID=CAMNT_0001432539 /DNA_START=85 /DNA_END=348 /DNA_ORIENTATION=-